MRLLISSSAGSFLAIDHCPPVENENQASNDEGKRTPTGRSWFHYSKPGLLLLCASVASFLNTGMTIFARSSYLWKFLQPICLGNQFVSEGHCTVWIVACDEDDNVVKVVSCSGRPN